MVVKEFAFSLHRRHERIEQHRYYHCSDYGNHMSTKPQITSSNTEDQTSRTHRATPLPLLRSDYGNHMSTKPQITSSNKEDRKDRVLNAHLSILCFECISFSRAHHAQAHNYTLLRLLRIPYRTKIQREGARAYRLLRPER